MCNSKLLTTPNQTLLWGIFGQASTQAVPVCKTPVRTASNQECLRRVAHNKIVLGPWFARHACITNPIVVRDLRKIDVWLMRCFRRDACLAHGREHKRVAVALTDTRTISATRMYDFVRYLTQGPCVAKRERSTLSMASALPLHGGGCLLHGWLLIVG
jgi:hypothetical protein